MRLLVLGHTWPEATTTAAGGRMLQLLGLFKEAGYEIHFASTSETGTYADDLSKLAIRSHTIQLNDSSFDKWIEQLQPSVVIFDRFMTEEQFGWRVSKACPEALKVLDTEDLHFLRQARQESIKRGQSVQQADLFSDLTKRELASIWRCDLSLIISPFEYQLLLEKFGVPKGILFYLPFLVDLDQVPKTHLGFGVRKDFICVGNFLHAPNLDAVEQLKILWPEIRKAIPYVELKIFGAYMPPQIKDWHDPSNGFYLEGWVEDLPKAMAQSRVQLAPIRFGAGLKGKILDAMIHGTPTITTPIGAEGMYGQRAFPGAIALDQDAFITEAIRLYTEEDDWNKASQAAAPILQGHFARTLFVENFIARIDSLIESTTAHRQLHFMGQILQHNQVNALKFMSKWIEEKNKD